MTPVKAAGYSGISRPSFPAEATISDPAAIAAFTALRATELGNGPPRLTLMIGARPGAWTSWLPAPVAGNPAAYNSPWAMSKFVPLPLMPSTRMGLIFTAQFTPEPPVASLPTMPMMPAVHSPWSPIVLWTQQPAKSSNSMSSGSVGSGSGPSPSPSSVVNVPPSQNSSVDPNSDFETK